MKIKERIMQLQNSKITTQRWIILHDNRTEYSPFDVGFFLEDADEFLTNEVVDRELDTENHKTIDGIKCILLGFGNEDIGGRNGN